jgi:hypothetical protein
MGKTERRHTMGKKQKRARKLKKTIVLPSALPKQVDIAVKLPVQLQDSIALSWEQRGKLLLIRIRDFVTGKGKE